MADQPCPGPPSETQITADANLGSSTAGDIAAGATGELYNSIHPLAIFAAVQRFDFLTAWQFYRMGEFQQSPIASKNTAFQEAQRPQLPSITAAPLKT